MKVSIETARCQGHGRCYDLAPAVFSEDEEGYGQVVADGAVTVENAAAARRAEANCPEHAITILENG